MRQFSITWVYVDGVCGKGYSVTCGIPAWEEANSANYRTSDVRQSKRGDGPHTVATFGRSSKLQSRYPPATHGGAHLKERNMAARRLVDLREGRTAAFSVDFMVGTWGRTVSDYNEGFCDGVRRLLRMPPKGCMRDHVARVASSTNRDNSSVWNSARTLNMDHSEGFW